MFRTNKTDRSGASLIPREFVKRLWEAGLSATYSAILLAVVFAMLASVDRESTGPVSGSGIIAEYEVIDIWLPPKLSILAKLPFPLPVTLDHDGLRRVLEAENCQTLRYAVTIRGHQVNGGYADTTFLRLPYDEPRNFEEFTNILADVRATSDSDADAELHYPTARLHKASEKLGRFPFVSND